MTERSSSATTSRVDSAHLSRWGFFGVLLVSFMGIVDGFVVNVAAPSIELDLGASFSDVQLVIAGYSIAYGVGLITGGRLGDIHGHQRVFTIGLLAFVAASMGCALAAAPWALILLRVVQGLSGALMLPQALAIIQLSFTGSGRARALGLYTATAGFASVVGQLLGGLLIALDLAGLGWRVVFLINLPIGILALLLTRLTMRIPRQPGNRRRLDLPGAAVLAVTLALILFPLVQGPALHWPAWTIVLLVGALLSAVAFGFVERGVARRGGDPLLPSGFFADRGVGFGLPIAVLFYSGNAGLFLVLAFFLQSGVGLSPLQSGLAFVALPIGFTIAATLSQRLTTRFGTPGLIGASTLSIAALILARLVAYPQPAGEQVLLLAPALLLSGLGQGAVAAPLIGTILAKVRAHDSGSASGVLLTASQASAGIGVAVVGALFNMLLGSGATAGQVDYVYAFRGALIALTVLAALTTCSLIVFHLADPQRRVRSIAASNQQR